MKGAVVPANNLLAKVQMRPLIHNGLLLAQICACALFLVTRCDSSPARGLSDLYDPDLAVLKGGDPDWNEVCLTIDDGPNPETTPRLLEILAESQVKATFFLIGRRARMYPDLVKRIAQAGHELGNHTMTHARLAGLGRQEIMNEMEAAREAIEAASGLRVRLFRPPGGGLSPDVYAVARELGCTTVLWTDLARDYERRPPAEIVESILSGTESGSIIVMHDGKPGTLSALPQIVGRLRAKGLSFVPAGRWAERCRLRTERRP